MDFREKRLIFMAPGDALADQPQGETAATENPRNYYDAATNTYYNAQGDPSSMSPEIAAAIVMQAPHEEVVVAEEPRIEAATEAQRERAKLDTAVGLSGLREVMGVDFQEVLDVLKDKKMVGEIKFGQLAEGFLFLGGEEAFQRPVKEQLSEADMAILKTALGKFYTFTDAEFPTFLPKLAAVATMGIFKSTIEAKYPHILTFDKFKDGVVGLKYELRFDGENPILDLSLSDLAAQVLYDQHAADEQRKVKEAVQQQQVADTKQAEEQRLTTDKEAFKEQLRQNPIGAFLVDFFDGPGPDGKPGMIDKLFEGKSPILAFLLGALGVGKFKGSYDNVRRMADKNPKLKGLLDQVEERVKPYRVDAPEAATVAAAAPEAPKFPQMDERKFGDVIVKGEVPETGLQLSKNYVVPTGKKLKVDLTLASLVLPAGKSLNVDGKSAPEAATGGKDREFKGEELVLVKDVPKGTIFHKGVKLELV